jgi:uncharacterized membrane protein YgdD (TMEM256/DUF423 family)
MITLLLSVIPIALLLGAFLLLRVWLAEQTDRLAARHRALGVLIWAASLLLLTALVLRSVAPSSTPTGGLGCFMALLLVLAIWQRQRLSRKLHERRNTTAT